MSVGSGFGPVSVDGAAPSSIPAPGGRRAPRPRGARSGPLARPRVVIAAAVALALVAAAAVVGLGLTSPTRSPGAAVREFLAALEAGDADRAFAIAPDPDMQAGTIPADVFAAAPAKIREWSVAETGRGDGTVDFAADYRIGERRFSIGLTAEERSSGSPLLTEWRVRLPVLGRIGTRYLGVDRIQVNGREVATQGGLIGVLPAEYEVGIDTDGLLDVTPQRQFPALSDDPRAALSLPPDVGRLDVAPTDELRATILTAVRDRLDVCSRERPFGEDDDCPALGSRRGTLELRGAPPSEVALTSYVVPGPSYRFGRTRTNLGFLFRTTAPVDLVVRRPGQQPVEQSQQISGFLMYRSSGVDLRFVRE